MSPLDYIHIPVAILQIGDLNFAQKIILSLAASLSKGLRLSNGDIGSILGISAGHVSFEINDMERKGYIRIENRQSKYRTIYLAEDPKVEALLLQGKSESNTALLNGLTGTTSRKTRNITKGTKEKRKEESTITPESFANYWNFKDNLPKVRNFTDDRKAKLHALLKEQDFANHWQEIIDRISQSAFCTGQNDRRWKADIDWLLKNSTNYTKVLEGKYDNQPTADNQVSIIKFDGPGPTKEFYQNRLDELKQIPESKRTAKDKEEIKQYTAMVK